MNLKSVVRASRAKHSTQIVGFRPPKALRFQLTAHLSARKERISHFLTRAVANELARDASNEGGHA